MLSEIIKFYTTPCFRYARDMGFLKESIATEARYMRLRQNWQPHLQNTQQAISEGIKSCAKRKRSLILGSGYLLDIPLNELAENFEEIFLVDVLHPRKVRKVVAKYKNVKLIDADVTGVMAHIYTNPKELFESTPNLFLDQEVDFVVSANLLSQLPIIPNKWLRKKKIADALIYGYCKHLVESHLNYLKKFPDKKLVITDIDFIAKDKDGKVVAKESAIYNVPIPQLESSWNWDLAPIPEINSEFGFEHKVGAFCL